MEAAIRGGRDGSGRGEDPIADPECLSRCSVKGPRWPEGLAVLSTVRLTRV